MKDIPIWGTKFVADDVIDNLDESIREQFIKLPESKQEGLIEKHKDIIAKCLEGGIMNDWSYIMSEAISETDLIKDIQKEVLR